METDSSKSLNPPEAKIAMVQSILTTLKDRTTRSNEPLFFETPLYKCLFPPNESEEFEELRGLRSPSSSNVMSPYFHTFEHIKVLGYMKPYPFAFFVDSCDEDGSLSAITVNNIMINMKVARQFFTLDRSWGQYQRTDMIEKAMALTRKLNSRANRRYRVPDLDYKSKSMVALLLDMRSSPGLPFASDPTKKFQIDYLERGFNLAIEINESAKKNPPSKVNAPPCIYTFRLIKHLGTNGECAYPMALQILEVWLMLDLIKTGYPENANDPFPSLCFLRQVPSREKLISEPDYCLLVRFNRMDFDMHPDLIDFALSIIQEWIIMKPEHVKLWEFLKYYLINTPVLLPSGQLVRKQGGTTSGSLIADVVKCVIRGFIGVYGMLSQGLKPEDIEGKIRCTENALIMAVPRTFSEHKFMGDVYDDLGFRIRKITNFDNTEGKYKTITTLD